MASESQVWRGHGYYDDAEQYMDEQWRAWIASQIADCDFTTVLDLAAGHGRNSARLLAKARKLYVVDLVEENVAFCRERFAGDARVVCLRNNGYDLAGVPDGEITLLYSWDAMVHFDSDVVRSYLREFRRILAPRGRAFCHHSNWTGNPGGFDGLDGNVGPHRRNFMSRELFAHYAKKEGLSVVRQQLVKWELPDLDCTSLVEKAH